MTITAKIIEDSISSVGHRLTTMQLRYPRFIHAEFMTHRVFSRNASSSRAIPVKRVIEDILTDPAMPMHWGKNQPGMQAKEELNVPVRPWYFETDDDACSREEAWLAGLNVAIRAARGFEEAGYHKQIVNRLLEPWAHINVVVTATEWDNFFLLRDHKDAQPEIMVLAQSMKEAMLQSQPAQRRFHLPYVTAEERADPKEIGTEVLIKLSAARCARVSYMTHEGKEPDFQKDLQLAHQLGVDKPPHLSPFEHQATCGKFAFTSMYANFQGWLSQRYAMERGEIPLNFG